MPSLGDSKQIWGLIVCWPHHKANHQWCTNPALYINQFQPKPAKWADIVFVEFVSWILPLTIDMICWWEECNVHQKPFTPRTSEHTSVHVGNSTALTLTTLRVHGGCEYTPWCWASVLLSAAESFNPMSTNKDGKLICHGFLNRYLKMPGDWGCSHKHGSPSIADADMLYPGEKIPGWACKAQVTTTSWCAIAGDMSCQPILGSKMSPAPLNFTCLKQFSTLGDTESWYKRVSPNHDTLSCNLRLPIKGTQHWAL